MSTFAHIPLGQRIPGSVHSVSCSLPTMRDVIGYEEKNPDITRHLTSGYPRFVVHPFTRQLAQRLAEKHGLRNRTPWLVSSARMADELALHLGADAQVFSAAGLHGVSHPENPGLAARAKTFLQHVGGFLSSREAEDHLVQLGALPSAEPENLFAGDATAEVKRHLSRAFPAAGDADLFLASSGMNAIYAAFRALSELQAGYGRTVWIQLGWLYLDTIAILKKFTAAPGDYIYARDVFDREALERLFAEHGPRIAGLVTEVPTNPLIQTPDLPWLAALARRHGAALILDPSTASAFNVDLLPHADVVVTSLTKYTASEGDVIAGLAVVNPASPHAARLRKRLPALLEPVYPRDLARLAAQIGETEAVLARMHDNVPHVVAFLEKHPAVRDVYWPRRTESRENFERVARAPGAVGAMISFTLRGPLEKFYDALRLPKGPSFGTQTTLICPFIFLAHYDLVTSEAGRTELAASGLDPNLLRLSVGTEPAEDIIAALAEALG
ncbi:MAG TPA: PLP-dependent transferase [Opitutaceae bacterium]|nr:PLP-dependent transferase [Opitutaceae bacterium]